MVIVPAEDYWSPAYYPEWLNPLWFASQDGLRDLMDSYFADPVIGAPDNRTRFNVWFARGARAEVAVGDGNCDWDDGDWRDDCPQGDVAFLLHQVTCRDYSSGDVFSTEPGAPGTLLHESGHIVLDLGDEYDDRGTGCTTHYHEADPAAHSNIWRTRGRCEDNTSLAPGDCDRFTECQGNWYRAQSGEVIMACNCLGDPAVSGDEYPVSPCEFGPDAVRMVHDVLDGYTAGAAAVAASDGETPVLVARFRFGPGGLTLLRATAALGTPPEHRWAHRELLLAVLDGAGGALAEVTVRDPRYRDYAEDPPGGGWEEAVEFSVALPLAEGGRTLEVRERASGQVLGRFELGPVYQRFCAEHPDWPLCRCEGDLDGDRDVDGMDLGRFETLWANGDPEADLNGDNRVDAGDLRRFARRFGRDDCPDLEPPPCDDGDRCTRDVFDPVTGQCVHRPRRCFDGSPCTQDRCNPQTGACEYVPTSCSDGVPCTVDRCDPFTGECLHEPRLCDDGDACTDDLCDAKTGRCVTRPVSCFDGDRCTMDLCDPVSGCFHVERPCDDGDPCTRDGCDPATGECTHAPIPGCLQACCSPFGQCADLPPVECEKLGGKPQGKGTSCQEVVCKPQ
ncbi:MAG: hypothetical protein Kow0092_20780 [Deferrisomatales bacterium]